MNFAPKLPISWRGVAVISWRKVWHCTTPSWPSDMKVKKKLKKSGPESLPRNVTHDAESWFMTDTCNFMMKGAISWHKVLIHNTRHDIEFWWHEIIAPRHEIPKQFHDGKVRISCHREGRLSGWTAQIWKRIQENCIKFWQKTSLVRTWLVRKRN